MMKLVLSLLMVIGLSKSAFAVITQSWGAGTTGAYLYDSTGALLDPALGTYQIQLVIDASGNTDMTQLMTGWVGLTGDANGWNGYMDATATDDIVLVTDMRVFLDATGGLSYFNEAGSSVADAYAGTEFYFRWFNADSQANATEAGFIYGSGGAGNLSGWTFGAVPPAPSGPTANLDYDDATSLGSSWTGAGPDGWATVAPVPEPGTMALFGLGIATLAAARRRKVAKA